MDPMIITVVVLALGFAFTNGFHDAANAIATPIATRALTPFIGVSLAAVMNFVGSFLGDHVAQTVSDTIDPVPGHSGLAVIAAALVGAIVWNLITWWRGLPTSSTHALIGGLAGAALASAGAVHWDTIAWKVAVPTLLAPTIAFVLAWLVMRGLLRFIGGLQPGPVNSFFRVAQTVSATALALGHGFQDAQKTMGVIFLALITAGHLSPDSGVPMWVVVASATAISLGTWAGGWRLVRTLGRRIVEIDPARGFVAESMAAAVMWVSAVAEAPISTTQTITAAITGTGVTKQQRSVRWGVVRSIGTAWLLTVPAAALMGAATYPLFWVLFGRA